MSDENRQAVRNAAPSADWQSLINLSKNHDVSACLYFNLKMLPGVVPEAVLSELSKICIANLGHIFQIRAETMKINCAFERAGIRTVHFKGLTLGERYYGDGNFRQPADVDVLVDPDHAIQAQEILTQCGYRYGHDEASFRVVKSLLKSPYSLRFLSQIALYGPVTIDLHWRVFDNGFIHLPPDVVYENTSKQEVVDAELTVFNPEMLFIIVCAHGVCSSWWRLKWIVDVAQILHSQSLDWQRLKGLARITRSERMIALGCSLASLLPGVVVPEAARSIIDSEPDTRQIATEMFNRMVLQKSKTDWKLMEKWKLWISMRESPIKKLVLLFRLATDAEISDWYHCQLPQSMFFLYRFVHLFFLAKASAPHLVQRLTRRKRQ